MRRRDLLLCGAGCCWLLLLVVARQKPANWRIASISKIALLE
jgi:hypothetical protein